MSAEVFDETKIVTLVPTGPEGDFAMPEEVTHPLHDETDRQIISLFEVTDEKAEAVSDTITKNTGILESEIKHLNFKIEEDAKVGRITLAHERDQIISGIKAVYEAQLEEIEKDRLRALGDLAMTEKQGENFLATCQQVYENIKNGLASQKIEHAKLTDAIERRTDMLAQTLRDIAAIEAELTAKITTREELLRDYDATEQLTKSNRQRLIELTRESSQIAEDEHARRRAIENTEGPFTEEALNFAISEMEQLAETARQMRASIKSRLQSTHSEIELANIENFNRNRQIGDLRDEIEALMFVAEESREEAVTLKAELEHLAVMKVKLAETATILENRAEALRMVSKGDISKLESIPLELGSLAQAVIGVSMPVDIKKLDKETIYLASAQRHHTDFSTVIPTEQSVINIEIPAEVSQRAGMSKVAMKTLIEADIDGAESETRHSKVGETVAEIVESINDLSRYVQDSVNGLLPEVASLLPEGLLTPGMRAKLRASDE